MACGLCKSLPQVLPRHMSHASNSAEEWSKPPPLSSPALLQAMHPVQIPKWLEFVLRIPVVGWIVILILFPISLAVALVSMILGLSAPALLTHCVLSPFCSLPVLLSWDGVGWHEELHCSAGRGFHEGAALACH